MSDGKQVKLPVPTTATFEEAEAARLALLAEVLAQLQAGPVLPSKPALTVSAAVEGFLTAKYGRVSKVTYDGYANALGQFATQFGMHPIHSLTDDVIAVWWRAKDWSSSTANTYLGAVQTLLTWARVPLKLERPPKESRGAETCLTDEQFRRVVERLRANGPQGDLCELLVLLRETGARPQELAPIRAADVDWDNACTLLKRHKTWKRTGRARVIHFNEAVMTLLRAQREKHGKGVLFPTRAGNAYSRKVIATRLGTVSKRVGFRVIAYGLGRHSFCSTALARGVSDSQVAALVGHVDTQMVHRHYSHLGENARALKDALAKATKKTG